MMTSFCAAFVTTISEAYSLQQYLSMYDKAALIIIDDPSMTVDTASSRAFP